MASAGSIEQTFVRLEDGIQRLTLPLPTGPKHVHCYLVDGTLFDTGLGLGEAPWESAGIERIAITHFHPDHVGGAAAAANATGAPVFQGGLDYAQCERVWGSRDWPERMAAWFTRHGVPAHVADDLIEQGHAFAPSATRSIRRSSMRAAHLPDGTSSSYPATPTDTSGFCATVC